MKRFQALSNFMLLTLLVVGLTACDSNIAGTQATQEADLMVVASGPDFTVLSQAIEAAELTATLRTDGPFTVFAPTNEAFAKLPESALRTLLAPDNQQQLTELLTSHVVPGRVYASEAFQLSSAKTLQSIDLNFRQDGNDFFVNDARILATDIEATNGIIHVIDTVLIPDWFERWLSESEIGPDPLDDQTPPIYPFGETN